VRLTVKRAIPFALAALIALVVAGCGDEGEKTVTETTTTDSATIEDTTTATETGSTDSSGETADLPPCDDTGSVRPCRTQSGAVLEEGGSNAGEVGDLPLCSEAAPPCRNQDGTFVEP
jgi:hypothetical protein